MKNMGSPRFRSATFVSNAFTLPSNSRRLTKRSRLRMLSKVRYASASLVRLPTGISMEVISRHSADDGSKASNSPLLFIHGSFHAAWCWQYFQDYFCDCGISSYAVSLRGSGRTVIDPGERCLIRGDVTLDEHLQDLDELLCALRIPPPVVVGHSTGGLIAQHWAQNSSAGKLAGLVLLASKPPYGHNALVWRIGRKIGLLGAWRITMGFARGSVMTNLELCREMFFSKSGTEYDENIEGDSRLLEYMQLYKEQHLGTNLKSLQGEPLKHPGSLSGKTLVMGGEADHIVDVQSIRDTAKFFGADGKEILIPNAPHVLMLCSAWKVASANIRDWLITEGYAEKLSAGANTISQC